MIVMRKRIDCPLERTQSNIVLFIAMIVFTIRPSIAQELEVVRPLTFGTLVILNNDSVGTVTVDEVGNISFSNNILLIEAPEYGIVRLSGFPANANLSVSPVILNSQLTTIPLSPEVFSFDAINTVSTVNINSDGTEEIRVGGQISTSGSTSENFANAEYTAGYSITVNF